MDSDIPIELLTSETHNKVDSSLQDALTHHLLSNDQDGATGTEESEEDVLYEIVKGGTNRGGDLLIDSLGFKYTLKRNAAGKRRHWRCSVRNTTLRCPAVVIELNGQFTRGSWKHEHLVGDFKPLKNAPHAKTPLKRNKNYTIIKGGSKQGMDLLKDSKGYTYTFRKTTCGGRKTTWACSVRNKNLVCRTTVNQIGTLFYPSSHMHTHLPGSSKPLEIGEEPVPVPKGDDDDWDMDVSVDFSPDTSVDQGAQEKLDSSGENGEDHSYTCTVVPAKGVSKHKAVKLKYEPRSTDQRSVSQTSHPCGNGSPDIVDLNVGGQTFTVARSTLTKFPESRLAAMVTGREVVPRDKMGSYFIDMDGDMFKHILSFLRFGTLPQCLDPVGLYENAMYLNLKSLIDHLESHKNVQERLYHDEIKACFNEHCTLYQSIRESIFSHLDKVCEQDEVVFELVTTCKHHIEKLPLAMSKLLEKYHWSLLRYTSGRCSCVQMVVCGKMAGVGRCIAYDLRQLGYKTLVSGISSQSDADLDEDDEEEEEEDGDAEERKALRQSLHCAECEGFIACVDYVWVGSGETPAPDWGSHWFKDLGQEPNID